MNCNDCCYNLPRDGYSYCTYDDGECIKISMLEKENAELEDKLANADYQLEGRDIKIKELEKEIAELKESNKMLEQGYVWHDYDAGEDCYEDTHEGKWVKRDEVYQLTKAKEIIEELSKSLFLAKGIVRDLIDDTVDFKESKERATYCYEQEMFDTYKKAVQFLKDC